MIVHAYNPLVFSRFFNLRVALIAAWLSGLLIGSVFIYEQVPLSLSLMRSVVQQPVSIVGIFVSVFFPLLITYFSVTTGKPVFILIVCFIKALAFGYTGALISRYFYSASWLVRLLFLFSDSIFLIALFIIWLRISCRQTHVTVNEVNCCACIGFSAVLIDFFAISPCLKGLF